MQTLRKLTNKGFLNVKVKRFHNLNTTLPQRFHNVILLAGIIMFDHQWFKLRKTGYNVNVIVGVGYYYLHT